MEQGHLSRSPDLRLQRAKVSESCTLAKKREIGAGAWGKRMDPTVKEGRFHGRREGGKKREFPVGKVARKQERVSGHKSAPGRSGESWFHSKSGQT